jgi:hypothetical protein
MGIFSLIIKKLQGNKDPNKKKKKIKTKKHKTMTPEQKEKRRAKFRNAFQKGKKLLVSGDIQKGATVATRFAQGKAVVIKKTASQEDKDMNPDEFIIAGIPIKKTYVYIGGAVLLVGGILIAKKMRRH